MWATQFQANRNQVSYYGSGGPGWAHTSTSMTFSPPASPNAGFPLFLWENTNTQDSSSLFTVWLLRSNWNNDVRSLTITNPFRKISQHTSKKLPGEQDRFCGVDTPASPSWVSARGRKQAYGSYCHCLWEESICTWCATSSKQQLFYCSQPSKFPFSKDTSPNFVFMVFVFFFFCILCPTFIQGKVTLLYFFFCFAYDTWLLMVFIHTHTLVNNIYREPFPFSCWLHSETPTLAKCLTLASPNDRVLLPLHHQLSPCIPTIIIICLGMLTNNNQSLASRCPGYFRGPSFYKCKLHTCHFNHALHEICKTGIRSRWCACTKSGHPRGNWTLKAVMLSTTWEEQLLEKEN